MKTGEWKQLSQPQVKSWSLAQASSLSRVEASGAGRCSWIWPWQVLRAVLLLLLHQALWWFCALKSTASECIGSQLGPDWLSMGMQIRWKNETNEERAVNPDLKGGERTLSRPGVARSSQSGLALCFLPLQWQGKRHLLGSHVLGWLWAPPLPSQLQQAGCQKVLRWKRTRFPINVY